MSIIDCRGQQRNTEGKFSTLAGGETECLQDQHFPGQNPEVQTAPVKGMGFTGGSVVKNLLAPVEDMSSIPGSGRSPGVGNGNLL